MIKSTNDGMPLFNAEHKFWPELKWYQKIWKWIVSIVVIPKFSKNALEPAEDIKQFGRIDDI